MSSVKVESDSHPIKTHYNQSSSKVMRSITSKRLDCNLIEYLRDEIVRIITINDSKESDSRHHEHFVNHVSSYSTSYTSSSSSLHEPLFIRLINLLDRMRYHFGPDPINPCFKRFFRIAIKSCSYRVALYLIQNYINIDSLVNHFNYSTPDYLFLLFFYAKHSPSSGNSFKSRGEFGSFLNLVKLLIPISNVNGFYSCYNMSLIELIINCMDCDEVKNHTKIGVASEITFYYMLTYCSNVFDVNMTVTRAQYNFCPNIIICNPLQVALNEGKFRAATKLIQANCNVISIDLNDVLFTGSSTNFICYKHLYYAGYKFPMENVFRQTYGDLYEGDPTFELFCAWLKERQKKIPCLSVLTWNAIKRFEPRTDLLLKSLKEILSLPDSFTNFANMTSFEIFEN